MYEQVLESLGYGLSFLVVYALLGYVCYFVFIRILGDGGGWKAVEFYRGLTTRPDEKKGGRP